MNEATRPGRRAEKTAATRRAIAEAAIDLFLEQGFAATTIDQIAEKAGVSRRSFFNYFDTKEAAAFPDHDARLAWLNEELAPLPEVGFEAAVEVIAAGVARFAEDELHRVRYRLLLHIPELREQDMRDDLDYEDALTEQFLRSTPSPTAAERFEAHRTAAQIVGAFRASLMTWAVADGEFDPADAIRAALLPGG